jgi:hypothetical protein
MMLPRDDRVVRQIEAMFTPLLPLPEMTLA